MVTKQKIPYICCHKSTLMTREKWLGHLAILGTNILFGLNIPISKSILSGWVSASGLTLLRMGFGAAAFWIASLFVSRERVAPRDLLMLVLCAFLGIVLNQTFFILGLQLTSPIDAGLIATLNPVLVMLISALVLKEPITGRKAGGVLIGACGALLIIWHSTVSDTGQSSSLRGNIYCLVSVVAYATYLVISRPIAQRYSSVTMMKWMFLFSSLMMIPFGIDTLADEPIFTRIDYSALLRLIYVLAGATFLAYLLIPMALKRIRPTTISMYNYLQPIIAGIVAILLGQNTLSWDKPVATLLIFSGVYLVTTSKSRADLEQMKEQ